MNRYQSPDEYFDELDRLRDERDLNAYIDAQREETIKRMDEDIQKMFEADMNATAAGIAFCDSAQALLDEIARRLREPETDH